MKAKTDLKPKYREGPEVMKATFPTPKSKVNEKAATRT
jgi:hypothetical protein